jgi:hypothetical protein
MSADPKKAENESTGWQRVTLVRGAPSHQPTVLDQTIGAWEGEETETYVPKAEHDRKLADAEFVRVEETHRLRAECDSARSDGIGEVWSEIRKERARIGERGFAVVSNIFAPFASEPQS